MNWNHRVLRRKDPVHGDWYGVHEVYYNDAGEPTMCTQEPASICGESIPELCRQLDHISMCIHNTEVLEYEQFKEGEELWRTSESTVGVSEKPKRKLKKFIRRILFRVLVYLY